MADSATARFLGRLQSLGSNLNTWGDDKLNQLFQLFDRGGKGYQALAMTGSATVSWTNYVATNDAQVAVLKLTGSLSSAASLTVPSVEWVWNTIWNATGQTITIKTSAGTGVAIPNGRKASVFCDATDCYFSVPNVMDIVTLTNATDIVDKTNLESAIAVASLPATAGTVLNSAADTTAGYVNQKITSSMSGAATVTISTLNSGANEQLNIDVGVTAFLTAGTAQTTSFTAAVNTIYVCNFTAAVTITLPASPSVGDLCAFILGGAQVVTLNPNSLKVNAATANLAIGSEQRTLFIGYTGTTDGWV